MKYCFLFFLNVLLSLSVRGTKIYSFDRMILACSGMTEAPYYFLNIDQNGNKYISNHFKNTITFGNDVMAAPANSNNIYSSCGIYVAKFGSTDSYDRSAVLASGDSIWASAVKLVGQHLFVAVSYSDVLYIGNDSLHSQGKSDVALLKFNLNLQLVDKLNIGGLSDESFQSQGFDSYNGQLYLGFNVNGSDTSAAYDNYQLVLGADTLHFDYDSMHARGDYVITRLDTSLQPIFSRSMGGRFYNACAGLRVGPQGVYIFGTTYARLGNEVGGTLFNYAENNSFYYFIARLDEQFSCRWVRKISHSGFGNLFVKKMELEGDRVIFGGSTIQSSGCGPTDFVRLRMDGGPAVGEGAFTFSCAYDTAGAYRWNILNEEFHDFYYSPDRAQLFFAKTVYQNEVMGGDTLQPCSGYDLAIGTVNLVTAQRKMVANLCSNGMDKVVHFSEDANHKLYALGTSNAGMVELSNTIVYPNQGVQNLFYLTMDSLDVYPLQTTATEQNQGLRLFPNPAADECMIEWPGDHGVYTLLIADATGQKVYLKKGLADTLHRVDISGLPSGLFFVQVRSEKRTLVTKLLVD